MANDIQIVDRGRGLQLSSSRITVQDLVPYLQEGWSPAEIMRWIPVLSTEEIDVVAHYYQQHKDELDEQDRRIREGSANRDVPPHIQKILRRGGEKMAALRKEFQMKQERNGDNAPR